MRALIMAGGAGSRLSRGEKPLLSICGRPMIGYIIDAFRDFGCSVVVAASPRTPMTQNWCRAHGVDLYQAMGGDYIRDMIEAVQTLDEHRPLFVSVADIPGLNADSIREIYDAYFKSGKDACSTWVPVTLVRSCRGGITYRAMIDMVEACPVGLNILRGDFIDRVQDEIRLVLSDPRLAINVNTLADRDAAEIFLRKHTAGT
jgi:adenosylcobinamide-phosphate guanylyltransferase